MSFRDSFLRTIEDANQTALTSPSFIYHQRFCVETSGDGGVLSIRQRQTQNSKEAFHHLPLSSLPHGSRFSHVPSAVRSPQNPKTVNHRALIPQLPDSAAPQARCRPHHHYGGRSSLRRCWRLHGLRCGRTVRGRPATVLHLRHPVALPMPLESTRAV